MDKENHFTIDITMSKWIDLNVDERRVVLRSIEEKEKLQQTSAIEKDWWVTAVLKALFRTSCKGALSFKGGTSLSKAWGVIESLSEDIDLALDHSFFGMEQTNKYQRDNLCRKARAFIIGQLRDELDEQLKMMGIRGYKIDAVTERMTKDGPVHINSNTDPTVLMVNYESVLEESAEYIPPRVKVEIGCLAMDEPTQERELNTLIAKYFPDEDNEMGCHIRTVIPTRTFLEKVFLLCEEFQRTNPRYRRMSRHLYDLERLMDTEFARDALSDRALYEAVVEHRRMYYDLKYVDYDKHAPDRIEFLPPDGELEHWREDYAELQHHFVFGKAMGFDKLMERMRELQIRFRNAWK